MKIRKINELNSDPEYQNKRASVEIDGHEIEIRYERSKGMEPNQQVDILYDGKIIATGFGPRSENLITSLNGTEVDELQLFNIILKLMTKVQFRRIEKS